MPNLIILADIHAHPAHAGAVRDGLMGLIAPTRAEAGCIQYDLHEDNSDPAHFFFYEIWASRTEWQTHMASAHLAAHAAATEGMVRLVAVHEMTHIG